MGLVVCLSPLMNMRKVKSLFSLLFLIRVRALTESEASEAV